MADPGDKGGVPPHGIVSKNALSSSLSGTVESGCAASASALISLTDYNTKVVCIPLFPEKSKYIWKIPVKNPFTVISYK